MKAEVTDFLTKNNIANNKIIVGISGGPDSTALLYILNSLKDKFNLTLEAAYVNHGIRSSHDNKKDRVLVENICSSLSIKLYIKDLEQGYINNKSKEEGRSLESIARDERYAFFNTLTDSNSLIAVGHNLDDNIETMIMRFFQGSTIGGLKGINAVRDNIIRPLYAIEKKDILNYLENINASYNIDITNLEDDYLRNKVRNRLIPIISDIFPGYKRSLDRLSRDFTEIYNLIKSQYSINNWKFNGSLWYSSIESFSNQQISIRKRVVYDLYNNALKDKVKDFRLPSNFLKPLEGDILSYEETILEGHGCRLYRSQNYIIFKELKEKTFFIKVDKKGSYHNSLYKINVSNIDNGGNYIPGISYPFIIRSVEKGTKELKKLKKLSVSPLDYDNIIIIENMSRTIAIVTPDRIIKCWGEKIGLYINIIRS